MMLKRQYSICIILILLYFIFPVSFYAQVEISKSVVSNGAVKSTGPVHMAQITIGQPVIGTVERDSISGHLGFWHVQIAPVASIHWIESRSTESQILVSKNFPNPFNQSTVFELTVPEEVFLKMSIYDMSGNLVQDVLQNNFPPGNYKIQLNRQVLTRGSYIYKIDTRNFQSSGILIVVD